MSVQVLLTAWNALQPSLQCVTPVSKVKAMKQQSLQRLQAVLLAGAGQPRAESLAALQLRLSNEVSMKSTPCESGQSY